MEEVVDFCYITYVNEDWTDAQDVAIVERIIDMDRRPREFYRTHIILELKEKLKRFKGFENCMKSPIVISYYDEDDGLIQDENKVPSIFECNLPPKNRSNIMEILSKYGLDYYDLFDFGKFAGWNILDEFKIRSDETIDKFPKNGNYINYKDYKIKNN